MQPYVLYFFIIFVTGGGKPLQAELEQELAHFRGLTFAENTQRTYRVHMSAYLEFCNKMGIPPVPVTEREVALYATYLARRLKPASVRQYINIIRIMHLECGYKHPFEQSWLVKTTIKGIEREKGCEVRRKAPITPQMLLSMKDKLNLTSQRDAIFWAACLTMFFGLLRKSNLFDDNPIATPSGRKQLTRDCFLIDQQQQCMTVLVKWSKNNQFKERIHKITLPVLADHPLCPITAIVNSFRLIGPRPPDALAFPTSSQCFGNRLRQLTGDRSDISSHSFRRGGATWALSCGVPGELIKVMGDWSSTVYLKYVDQIPQLTLDYYRMKFCKNLPLNIIGRSISEDSSR